jgi:polysaccharide biosynthesis protein PslG
MIVSRSRPLRPVAALCAAMLCLLLAAVLTASAAASPSSASAGSARGGRTQAHVASSPPLGGLNVIGLGFGSTRAEADKAISMAHALHARVVRSEIPWSVFEPNGPGQINPGAQAFTDRLMSDAAAAGIRVIATVDSSPCWATAAPASLLSNCSPQRRGSANGWPPSDPRTYASFVAYLAQRYGADLAAIEIWNEPDQSNENYFGGPEKAKRYAAVLRAAYPAIKAADPSVAVLGGSFVGSNGVFLRALYAAGIKGYYDGLAVHFYTLTLAALRSIHEIQLANGDHTQLWLTEFGWSSCWPQKIQQDQGCVTRATQALNLTNVLHALAKTSYVAVELVYKLEDGGSEDFGALTVTGARKPAAVALSRLFVSPFGSISPMTLSLRSKGGRVIASGSGPVGDFIQLEAFQGSTLRFRAEFAMNRFNDYSLALPAVLGSKGLRVRVYQVWTGLSRGVQKSI